MMRTLRALISVAIVLIMGAGCVDKATRAALDEMKNQNRIDVQKAEDAGKLARTVATTRPSTHPLDFANSVVQDIRGPLVRIGFICGILALAGLGAMWAAKSVPILGGWIGSIVKIVTQILVTVSAGCWLSLWFAPLAFWIITGTAVAALALLIVQLAKAHWDIRQLFNLHNENVTAIGNVTNGTPAVVTKVEK